MILYCIYRLVTTIAVFAQNALLLFVAYYDRIGCTNVYLKAGNSKDQQVIKWIHSLLSMSLLVVIVYVRRHWKRKAWKYSCDVCKASYIDKTMRTFATRIVEHSDIPIRTGILLVNPPYSAIGKYPGSHGGVGVNPSNLRILDSAA